MNERARPRVEIENLAREWPEGLTAEQSGATQGGSLRLLGEILGNVSRTRSEISLALARNSRA